MRNTPRTSLQQKLMWVIMATTGATLLVASLFFVFNDVVTLRESKVRDLKTLAEILGTNSQAALSFSDANAATTTLSGVRAKAFVNAAALYNKDGRLFASYQRARNPGPLPASPGPVGHWFRGSSLVLVAPVMMDQDRIGTVYLQESMGDITLRLQRYAGVALLIILGASLFALLVSSRLQRAVSEPILELAETATAVSREQNYALRAKRRTDDEIGVLIDSFNGMLGQIERNSAELQELNSQLADSEQKALAANQAKSAFLARMSHELRTPLNAIIGYSEMLQEEAEDLGQPDFLPDLRKINSAGKHLLALINDILDLSKVEAGKMDLYLEDFAVDSVVREVCATVEPLLQKNRNRLQVDCPADIGMMSSDLTKVRQMLFNLLSNASKFTEDGEVGVQVRRESKPEDGDWIRFTVTDTGIGMSPDQVDKVFDAFVQGDASTTRKYGAPVWASPSRSGLRR